MSLKRDSSDRGSLPDATIERIFQKRETKLKLPSSDGFTGLAVDVRCLSDRSLDGAIGQLLLQHGDLRVTVADSPNCKHPKIIRRKLRGLSL